jgi:hypothetical protein
MIGSPIRSFFEMVGIVAVPVMVALAYREWKTYARRKLPMWRNLLGIVSIAIIAACWVTVMALLGVTVTRLTTGLFSMVWFNMASLGGILGTFLSLALTGKPRLYNFLAGVFFVGLCFASIVH